MKNLLQEIQTRTVCRRRRFASRVKMATLVLATLVIASTIAISGAGAYEFGANLCTPPPSGMVAWWGGDNNALDMVGTNHGTLMNGATFSAGMVGQAFSFDGVNDYVDAGSNLNLANSSFSFSVWVKRTTSHSEIIFGQGVAVINQGLQVGFRNANTFTFDFFGSGPLDVSGSFADTSWHHWAGTYNASTQERKLYRDGVFIGGDIKGNYVGTGAFLIGKTQAAAGFNTFGGLLDEAQIYNRALSPAEIQSIYDAGSGGLCRSCAQPPSGMISWWGGNNNALDTVGTNHATLVNGATYAVGLVGQAFSFDGVNDYVEMAGTAGDFGSAPFTVDFWMDSNNNGANSYLVGKSHPDGGHGWDIRLNGNAVRVTGVNGWAFNITSDASATANTWHHIAVAAGATQVNLYIDGILKGTSGRSAISSTANPFRFGLTTNFGGGAFNGLIDEVEIFDRALSQAEIQTIYNAGSAGKCTLAENSPPVAVDDTATTQTNTAVTTVNVLSNDTDVDGDTLSVSAADTNSVQGGTVSDNGNGTFDYLPPFNFVGADSFNYTVSDGNGGTDVGTVEVTVDPKSWASFRVTKDFSDDNPLSVTVHISCSTGLPLNANATILDDGDADGGVNFLVTSFMSGELDCTVTETPVAGYAADYENISVPESSEVACFYTAVVGGAEHSCVISNEVLPVSVEITKQWITLGVGGDKIDKTASIQVFSPTNIEGGDACFSSEANENGYCESLDFEGPQTQTQSVLVLPHWQGVTVLIDEQLFDDAIETDNACDGSVQILPNEGAACTITNTVFFEGVPTLNQYGLAVLALLMLAGGLIGLRRFV